MKKILLISAFIPFVLHAQSNVFPSTGNVGIGTLSPAEKLEVNGDISVGSDISDQSTKNETYGNKLYFLGASNNSDPLWMARYNVSGNPNVSELRVNIGDDPTHFGDKLVVGVTEGSETWHPRFIIQGDGGVGIGTVDPGTWKLAVNGNIRAKEIKVETGWSDFVFEDSYHLPTLEEVEQHIKEKGHLKDIPSAKEVEENGIFLGEMDAKLLQKIEELMLYTLQQQKEIEILRQEIKKLQEKQ